MTRFATSRGRLVAIEGVDGAGKSSVIASLALDPDTEFVLVNKHADRSFADDAFTEHLQNLRGLVYNRPKDLGPVAGDLHWFFALAAWHSLIDELAVKPLLAQGKHVLLDNSYIKTAARYTVLGGYDAMISEGLSKLTQPDLVVLLDVDPRRALARRHGVFSPWKALIPGVHPRISSATSRSCGTP